MPAKRPKGARTLLPQALAAACPLKVIFADRGYMGQLITWAEAMFGCPGKVIRRREAHQIKVLPKRWIVERTFA